MITDADVKKLKGVFATKDDLKLLATKSDLAEIRRTMATKSDLAEIRRTMATKSDLAETKETIVKEITDFLHEKIILTLERHERRLDRLEKTVGGFPPMAD